MSIRVVIVAAVAAAAIAATAAACGVRVSQGPADPQGAAPPALGASPAAAAAVSPHASPTPLRGAAAPTPLPGAAAPTPSPSAPASGAPPAPAPAPTSAAAGAAARRAASAAAVKAALPAFDALARDLFARSGVPGAAVAVVAGDEAVYVNCLGVRDAGRAEKVDKDTVFPLASASRAVTATMLAALVGRREVAWDDTVRTYWPGFALWDPWVSDHATFVDLLAERSGLPALAGDELLAFGYGRAEILRRVRHLAPAAGFRTARAAQHALPTAAAMAAVRATGVSWRGLVGTIVLEPLGMRSTTLSSRAYLESDDRVAPHTLAGGTAVARAPQAADVFAPALGVSSSVADLVPFVRLQLDEGALAGVRVVAPEPLALTHSAITAGDGGDGRGSGPVAAGLGWETFSFDGRRIVETFGDSAAGTGALLTLVPEDGVAVVVLANAYPQGGALARALARTLVDLYVNGTPSPDSLALAPAPGALAEGAAPAGDPAGEAPPVRAPPRARGAYTGTYTDGYYGTVRVRRGAGAGLDVKLGRGRTLRYVPWDGDTWLQPDSGTVAGFTVRDARAVSVELGLLAFDGRDGRFRRVP